MKLGQLASPGLILESWSSTCSGREPLEIGRTVFFTGRTSFLSPNHQCQCTVRKKALTVTSDLASFFLHPLPDSWWKVRCSLYARCLTLVPKTLVMFLFVQPLMPAVYVVHNSWWFQRDNWGKGHSCLHINYPVPVPTLCYFLGCIAVPRRCGLLWQME